MAGPARTLVAERYELGSIIGRGGHGVVYRAVDRTTGRDVAVKMLGDGVANDPEYAARLAREQEALVALAGTSAVAVYDLCRGPKGSLCLVMELLDGIDFEKHLEELEARGERLSLERLNAIIEPIVETLERAHDAEILHRDLKPANIFLLSDGHGVRLFDFGLSRKRNSARLTVVGTIMGSPSYIAPEVWKGMSDELDSRVDVYSLGVILFRALSGKLPFEGSSLRDSFLQTTTAPRPSLCALRPDLPPKVDDWVKKALAVDRGERFQSVTALFHGLLGALRYVPPPRAYRPVAESLVNAWRAARTAFRRFIPGSTPPPPLPPVPPLPSSLPPRRSSVPSTPPDTSAIDESWMEIMDDEIETTLAPPAVNLASIDDSWDEVTDAELDRRSLYGTTSVVTEWTAPPPRVIPPLPTASEMKAAAAPETKTDAPEVTKEIRPEEKAVARKATTKKTGANAGKKGPKKATASKAKKPKKAMAPKPAKAKASRKIPRGSGS